MRPTHYTRELSVYNSKLARNFDFRRNPNIQDISTLFQKLAKQDIYKIDAKYIKVCTQDYTITDMANLRGISETQEGHKELLKNPESVIYFETEDRKCVGNVKTDTEFYFPPFFPYAVTILGLVSTIFVPFPHKIGGIAATVLGGTGIARELNNNYKNKRLKIEIGPPQDIFSPVPYHELVAVKLKSKEFNKEAFDNPKDLLDAFLKQIHPEYSLDDIDRFNEFRKFIEKLE